MFLNMTPFAVTCPAHENSRDTQRAQVSLTACTQTNGSQMTSRIALRGVMFVMWEALLCGFSCFYEDSLIKADKLKI